MVPVVPPWKKKKDPEMSIEYGWKSGFADLNLTDPNFPIAYQYSLQSGVESVSLLKYISRWD